MRQVSRFILSVSVGGVMMVPQYATTVHIARRGYRTATYDARANSHKAYSTIDPNECIYRSTPSSCSRVHDATDCRMGTTENCARLEN